MFSGIRIVEGTQQVRAALLVALALSLLLARGFITIIGGAAPPRGMPASEKPAVLRAPLAFEPNLGVLSTCCLSRPELRKIRHGSPRLPNFPGPCR